MAARTVMNLVGQVYGKLTVIAEAERRGRDLAWICRCECGKEKPVTTSNLRSGGSTSCGCVALAKMRAAALARKHGQVGTRSYSAWKNMRGRCYNKKNSHYPRYGGRGIVVCDRWKDSFPNFYADMGDAPDGMQIDRVNNDGNYEPANCRWATPKQQQRNTSQNKNIEVDGRVQSLAAWSEESGIKAATILGRLMRGVPAKEAVSAVPLTAAECSRLGKLAKGSRQC